MENNIKASGSESLSDLVDAVEAFVRVMDRVKGRMHKASSPFLLLALGMASGVYRRPIWQRSCTLSCRLCKPPCTGLRLSERRPELTARKRMLTPCRQCW